LCQAHSSHLLYLPMFCPWGQHVVLCDTPAKCLEKSLGPRPNTRGWWDGHLVWMSHCFRILFFLELCNQKARMEARPWHLSTAESTGSHCHLPFCSPIEWIPIYSIVSTYYPWISSIQEKWKFLLFYKLASSMKTPSSSNRHLEWRQRAAIHFVNGCL
jgi:hypothetical protein